MQYNFDEVVDRSRNFSAKHDERERKFGRRDVIPLWVADMDFKAPQPVTDAIAARNLQGIYGYTSRPQSYFASIAAWQERRNGWKIDTSLMSFCPGVVPALCVLVSHFSNKGDKVLIQVPVYPEFYEVVENWDREVVENRLLEKDGVYSIDWADFEEKLKEVKLFILCSPHNPLGIVWSREDLLRMSELCLKHGVLVLSDEIHSDLILWGNKHIPTATLSAEIAANTITCISGTKTFNLAGLQAATTVFPDKKSKALFDSYWNRMDMNRNNCFSAVAMEAAFTHGEEWLEQLLRYLEGNMRFIHDYCGEHIPQVKPNIPQSTYLVWLDCRGLGMDNGQLKEFMIHKAGIGLNEGWFFDRSLTGFMRLNAACSRKVLETAMEQLRSAIAAL